MTDPIPLPPTFPPAGPRIRGRDLLTAIVIGLALYWFLRALLQESVGTLTTVSERVNFTVAVYSAWIAAWFFALWFAFLRRGWGLADLGYAPVSLTWKAGAIVGGIIAVPAALIVVLLMRPVTEDIGITSPRDVFGTGTFTILHGLVLLLYAGGLVPIVEELLFRGLIFRWLRQHLDFLPSAIISAALFALVHPRFDQMITVGLVGFVFAWMTERSRSIAPAILMHQTYNSAMLLTSFTVLWSMSSHE